MNETSYEKVFTSALANGETELGRDWDKRSAGEQSAEIMFQALQIFAQNDETVLRFLIDLNQWEAENL